MTPSREGREAGNVKFWDCDPGRESLVYTTITEAVEAWADNLHPDPLPETVTVYGWCEMALPSAEWIASLVEENVIELLDSDFGDPEDATQVSDDLKAAALAYANVVRREYPVYMCEQTTSRDVNVRDHVPAEWMLRPEKAAVSETETETPVSPASL